MSLMLPLSELYTQVHSQIESQQKQQKNFDVIVLGVGSMGSATCYYLAKQGHRVLGLEQFDIPHELGSHAGQSRIIRKAYFEHPDYVPLLEAAYNNWRDLENETGTQLYFKTGLLYFGKPDSQLIKGLKLSAEKYKVPVYHLSSNEMASQFSQFQIPDDYERMIEPDAGFVTPERAILTYTGRACQLGASVHVNEKTIAWKKVGRSITVKTDRDTYYCSKLVITAGAWAGKIIPTLSKQLSVTRQTLAWMQPRNTSKFESGNFPCWTIADQEKPGIYYGFPMLSASTFGGPIGLKLGHHTPGLPSDADAVDRIPAKADEDNLISMLNKFIPEGYASIRSIKTCLYTYTPDENFILDFVPGFEKEVVMAAGFSGHGFKFASAVGEVMADLATKGSTEHPIGFLNAARF